MALDIEVHNIFKNMAIFNGDTALFYTTQEWSLLMNPILNAQQIFTGRRCDFSTLIPKNVQTGQLNFYGLGIESRGDNEFFYACPPHKFFLVTNPGGELARLVSPKHHVIGFASMREYNPLTEGPQPVQYLQLVPSAGTSEDEKDGVERFTIQDPRFSGEKGINRLSVVLASARGAAAPDNQALLIELKGSLVRGGELQIAEEPARNRPGLNDRGDPLIRAGYFYMRPEPV